MCKSISSLSRPLRRSEHGRVLINMSFALLCLYITFFIAATTQSIPALCGISAALVHYFMLVYFMWTATEAVFLYIKLVKILGRKINHFCFKFGLISWCKCYYQNRIYIRNLACILPFSGSSWHCDYFSWSWLPLLLSFKLVSCNTNPFVP